MTNLETIFVAIALGVLGAFFGSFAGAQVWRLRLRQLKSEESDAKKLKRLKVSELSKDESEYRQYLEAEQKNRQAELKRLLVIDKPLQDDRSTCLHCKAPLRAIDLIPIASWMSTRGKCRYCKQSIGRFEIVMELGLAALFAFSFIFWPFELDSILSILSLTVWLMAAVVLAIAFAYDAKWLLLPDVVNYSFAVLGLVFVGLQASANLKPGSVIINAVLSVAILSGLYLALWLVSKGRWVGFGDVKLGIGLGLFITNWQLALATIFFANLIGLLIVLPGLASGKLTRKSAVPFGPMLMAGLLVSFFFGNQILDWYMGILI